MRHYVDCTCFEEAEQVKSQCEKEGFVAEIFYWGSCSWEVQFWKEEI